MVYRFLKIFLSMYLAFFVLESVCCVAAPSRKVITDLHGQPVSIPTRIDRVISTSPPVTTIVYMLAPDKLLGWNFTPETRYMPARYAALPVLGGWFGQCSGNHETMLAAKPDIVLYQTILDQQGNEALELIENQQRRFGTVPVAGISGSADMSRVDESIRFIGDILDAREKADRLIKQHQDILRLFSERVQGIPSEQRVRVYYAEGVDGLSTDPCGSRHSSLITLCGGLNVADCPLKQGLGLSKVSLEQLLRWNPEVIITGKKSIFNAIMNNPLWSRIDAVRKKRVYLSPHGPFCWFDRPPGASTIPGLLWTAVRLYPRKFEDINLNNFTKRFYAEFYHYSITGEELNRLLGPPPSPF